MSTAFGTTSGVATLGPEDKELRVCFDFRRWVDAETNEWEREEENLEITFDGAICDLDYLEVHFGVHAAHSALDRAIGNAWSMVP